MSRFLVTTPGASATRWLTYALANHPDVYAAHGKFALDSVSNEGISNEKRTGDHGSLTRGNELQEFYAARTLDEIFEAYRAQAPAVTVWGNVHTFTISALLDREEDGQSLEGINVVNLVRHPIGFVESHTALVKSADEQPDLSVHYRRQFCDAVEFCPEALLVQTDQPLEAMAFVVSCYSAMQAAQELKCNRWPVARMEELTTNATALQSFCQQLTGLSYSLEDLTQLVQGGAINSHRAKKTRVEPVETWRNWPAWKRDVFALFTTAEMFDLWKSAGYDLRSELNGLKEPETEDKSPLTCLGDFAEELGLKRSLPPAVLAERDFCGFHLFDAKTEAIALAVSLGEINCRDVDLRTLAGWQRDGLCMIAPSVEVLREVLQSRPPVLEDSFPECNVIRWRGRFAIMAKRLGAVDITQLSDAEQTEYEDKLLLLWGDTLEQARAIAADWRDPADESFQHPQLVEAYLDCNIVEWRGRYVAVSEKLGSIDLTSLAEGEIRRITSEGQLLWGESMSAVRRDVKWINDLHDRMNPAGEPPPRFVESRGGYNLLEWQGKYAAVAQAIGPVCLETLDENARSELVAKGTLIWAKTLQKLIAHVNSLAGIRLHINPPDAPPEVAETRQGFNLIQWRGRFLALAQVAGAIELSEMTAAQEHTLVSLRQLFWADTHQKLRKIVDDETRTPSEGWMSRLNRNVRQIPRIPVHAARVGKRLVNKVTGKR